MPKQQRPPPRVASNQDAQSENGRTFVLFFDDVHLTATTARFSSPLGVYDFQKRSSIIGCSAEAAAQLAPVAAELARGEGLHAHARSAELRGRPSSNAHETGQTGSREHG